MRWRGLRLSKGCAQHDHDDRKSETLKLIGLRSRNTQADYRSRRECARHAGSIEARPDLLVHTPHIGNLAMICRGQKDRRREDPMTSTLAVFVPHFDAKGNRGCSGMDCRSVANTLERRPGPVNARLLWRPVSPPMAMAPTHNGSKETLRRAPAL